MTSWLAGKEGVALRQIDLGRGGTAAMRQMHEEFPQIQGIPHVRVYGKGGDFLGEVSGADLEAIRTLVEKGR